MRTAVRAAGIQKRITPHTLRHSFATHAMRAGNDPRKWLHGISGEQWTHVLDLVRAAEGSFSSGNRKLEWVKAQLAEFVKSERGRAIFDAISQRALNWLIETAVGFLTKA